MASGVALVAAVGWGLIRSGNDARDRAVWAARTDARDLALAMRAALRRPAVLELCDAAQRFDVRDGSVIVDETVGWLESNVAGPMDTLWQLKLTAAERAEFVAKDLVAAQQHYDELLERIDDSDPKSLTVLAKAAWFAHRHDDLVRANAFADRMAAQLNKSDAAALGDTTVANALASHTLLVAALQQPLDEARWQQLVRLPEQLATATVHRLKELGIATDDAMTTLREVATRRATLTHAATFVRQFAHLGSLQVSRESLVLWFPGSETGTGQGAIVPADWLEQLPGLGTSRATTGDLPPIPDRGRVVFTQDDNSEPIVATLAWAAPPPVPAMTAFAQQLAKRWHQTKSDKRSPMERKLYALRDLPDDALAGNPALRESLAALISDADDNLAITTFRYLPGAVAKEFANEAVAGLQRGKNQRWLSAMSSQNIPLSKQDWLAALSGDREMCVSALHGLNKNADPTLRGTIEDKLAHSDSSVRMAASTALVRMFGSDAVSALLPLLQDGSDSVVKHVRGHLTQLRELEEQRDFWGNKNGRNISTKSSAAKLIGQAMPTEDKEQRVLAIRSLARLNAPEALPYLIDWTKDKDADVQTAAKKAIAAMHQKGAIDTPKPKK